MISVKLVFLLLSFLLILCAICGPLLEHINQFDFAYFCYKFDGYFCHQLPTKCFWIFQRPMGLCARCTGIYLGVFWGLGYCLRKNLSLTIPLFISVCLIVFSIASTLIVKSLRLASPLWFSFFLGLIGGLGWGCFLGLIPKTRTCAEGKNAKKNHDFRNRANY